MPLDRPSGRGSPRSLALLALICAGAGIASGIAEGLISAEFSLLFVFPALIGLAVGRAANAWVIPGRLRAPLLVGAIAFGGAALGQLAVHGTEYVRFRNLVAQDLEAYAEGVTVDEALEAEVGRGGFLGYLQLTAREGLGVKKAGGIAAPSMVRSRDLWGLWAFEFVLAGLTASAGAVRRTRDPYCESCDHWYDRTQEIASGAPEKAAWKPLADAAESGADWGPAVERLGVPSPKAKSAVLLLGCATCRGHRPVLIVQVVAGTHRDEPQVKVFARTSLTPDRADALVLALARCGTPAGKAAAS